MHEPYLICSWIYVCICIQFNILYHRHLTLHIYFPHGWKIYLLPNVLWGKDFFIMRKIYIYTKLDDCVLHSSRRFVVALNILSLQHVRIFSSQSLEEDHGLWCMYLIQHKNYNLFALSFCVINILWSFSVCAGWGFQCSTYGPSCQWEIRPFWLL